MSIYSLIRNVISGVLLAVFLPVAVAAVDRDEGISNRVSYIYTDDLESGWNDFSIGFTSDYFSSTAYSGSFAWRTESQGASQFTLSNSGGVDVGSNDALIAWIRSEPGKSDDFATLQVTTGEGTTLQYNIDQYLPPASKVENSWQKVQFPLAELNITNTSVTKFNFIGLDQGVVYYWDDMHIGPYEPSSTEDSVEVEVIFTDVLGEGWGINGEGVEFTLLSELSKVGTYAMQIKNASVGGRADLFKSGGLVVHSEPTFSAWITSYFGEVITAANIELIGLNDEILGAVSLFDYLPEDYSLFDTWYYITVPLDDMAPGGKEIKGVSFVPLSENSRILVDEAQIQSVVKEDEGDPEYPDLLVDALQVQPGTVSPGDQVTVSVDILNAGTLAASTFQSEIRLSASNQEVAESDLLLGSFEVASLAAGFASTSTITVEIPNDLNEGSYYIWTTLDVNGSSGQQNTGNDKSYTPLIIDDGVVPVPDVVIEELAVLSGSARPGEAIQVGLTLKNIGNAPASAFLTNIRLNTSAIEVTVNDVLLDQCSIDGLEPGATTDICSTTVTLPSTLKGGIHYIWAIVDVDSEAGQENEDNDKAKDGFFVDGEEIGIVDDNSFYLPTVCNTEDWNRKHGIYRDYVYQLIQLDLNYLAESLGFLDEAIDQNEETFLALRSALNIFGFINAEERLDEVETLVGEVVLLIDAQYDLGVAGVALSTAVDVVFTLLGEKYVKLEDVSSALTVADIGISISEIFADVVAAVRVTKISKEFQQHSALQIVLSAYYRNCGDSNLIREQLQIPDDKVGTSNNVVDIIDEFSQTVGFFFDRDVATASVFTYLNQVNRLYDTLSTNQTEEFTPSLASVFPQTLYVVDGTVRKEVTLLGTGFNENTDVFFDDGSGDCPCQALPAFLNIQNSRELSYQLLTGSTSSTWSVWTQSGSLVSNALEFEVVLTTDATAPAAPREISAAQSGWSKNEHQLVRWESPDDQTGVSAVRWTIDSASEENRVPLVQGDALPLAFNVDGVFDVNLWLEDGAGNQTSANSTSITLQIDQTRPDLLITGESLNKSNQVVQLSGTVSDTLSGVSHMFWVNDRFDFGEISAAGETWETGQLPLHSGEVVFGIFAVDRAGNVIQQNQTVNNPLLEENFVPVFFDDFNLSELNTQHWLRFTDGISIDGDTLILKHSASVDSVVLVSQEFDASINEVVRLNRAIRYEGIGPVLSEMKITVSADPVRAFGFQVEGPFFEDPGQPTGTLRLFLQEETPDSLRLHFGDELSIDWNAWIQEEVRFYLNSGRLEYSVEDELARVLDIGTFVNDSFQYDITLSTVGTNASDLIRIDYLAADKSQYINVSNEADQSPGEDSRAFAVELYPNPFSALAHLQLHINKTGPVEVLLYNQLGQRVRALYKGYKAEGDNLSIDIDGSGLSSGVYYVVISESDRITRRGLVRLK